MSLAIARDALGIGLRVAHYPYVFSHWPAVDYFEIISENYLSDAAIPQRQLAKLRDKYPLVLHGVGLNLLGHEPISQDYLDRLCRLADSVSAPFVSDHLCWTGAHGITHHDLLPTPFVPQLVELAAERAYQVQRRLGRPLGLENLSSYVSFQESSLTEWEFYTAVVRESGCWSMLDINNIYVSSVNHGFDAQAYLRSIDFARVLQVHIAGHTREPAGNLVDTHAMPVSDAVWQLYAEAWKQGGPFPTLLEWDDQIPPFPAVMAELAKAQQVRQ